MRSGAEPVADGRSGTRPACSRRCSKASTRFPTIACAWSIPDGYAAEIDDPYRYGRIIGDFDLYLFGEGNHTRIYDKLGAHPMRIGDVRRRALRGLGAQRAARQRRRRLQRLGRPRAPDARRSARAACGRSSSRRRGSAITTSSRFAPRDGHILLKIDPYGLAFEVPPLSASIVTRSEYQWKDDRVDGQPRGRRLAGSARPMAVYEVHLGSWARIPEEGDRYLTYRELAEPADPLREGDGLHPHRAAAGDGAPVLGVVGLSGHGLLRADQPVRIAGRLQGLRRRLPPQRHRRDSRLGARATSRRTSTRSPASTARRSTSTPIRARASTATGAR